MTIALWIWVSVLIAGSFLLAVYQYHRRLGRCLLYSLTTGLGSLGLLWVLRYFVPLQLNITPLTVVGSALLGVPGLITMLLIPLL